MTAPGLDGLSADEVRTALGLLGEPEVASARAAALRQLGQRLRAYGIVRSALDDAPEGARAAYARLATGPATVDELLGRGWWGRGTLPPPLDWLQVRALVLVGADGLVHATAESREGYSALRLDLPPPPADRGPPPLRVEAAGCVVIADQAQQLDQVLSVTAAGLRAVAPTVAVSTRSATIVRAALRGAGIALGEDLRVAADPAEPALPGMIEEAVGPKGVRALVQRALSESRQLHLEYFASSRGGAATERVVDPWSFHDDLLVGYCHLRTSERTFALDRIGRAQLLSTGVAVPRPVRGETPAGPPV